MQSWVQSPEGAQDPKKRTSSCSKPSKSPASCVTPRSTKSSCVPAKSQVIDHDQGTPGLSSTSCHACRVHAPCVLPISMQIGSLPDPCRKQRFCFTVTQRHLRGRALHEVPYPFQVLFCGLKVLAAQLLHVRAPQRVLHLNWPDTRLLSNQPRSDSATHTCTWLAPAAYARRPHAASSELGLLSGVSTDIMNIQPS